MRNLIQSLLGAFGAVIAAACCLGAPLVLGAMGAVGLGFLVQDAYLLPLFAGFVALIVWAQYRSGRARQHLQPFYVSLVGGVIATVALGLMVTGIYPMSWAIYAGFAVLLVGVGMEMASRWQARRAGAEPAASADTPRVDMGRRAVNGAAIATAAAGIFFTLYKTVDTLAPAAKASEIGCYGVNACKGQTACTTAFNACTGQNKCKGQGFLNLTEKQCLIEGGVPLAGSPADPAA
jgi:mercuric ion transport protein